MSGTPVFLGQPIGAVDGTSTAAHSHPPEADITSANIDRPSTHGSGHSELAAPESLASSQTMNASTPIGEKSRLEHPSMANDSGVINEKNAVAGNSHKEVSLNEKHGKQEMVELEDGLVFLGTEAQSGKAIIKPKDQLRGGPYSQPKW
jgi:hypothetical protein